MKTGKASATARLIAGATVLCASDPATADLVPPGSAEWCEAFLSESKTGQRLVASCRYAPARVAWRLLERATHPGIVLHWMMRKRWIESRVRAAIADGTDQVVVLGAGFDTLGVRIAAERPDIRVVEIDHPATVAEKRPVIETIRGSARPILAEVDFARGDATNGVLPPGAIDCERRTIFIAEGLLMYLPEAQVRSLLRELATATDAPSRLVFSFMVKRASDSIGFEPRSALVSFWLAIKHEPFRWSLDPARVEEFTRELGWAVREHADSCVLYRLGGSAVTARVIARGENVVLASRIDSAD
jgi:methyltransferase (TIGR00027 family)